MTRVRVRRAAITVAGVVSLALLATACPTPPVYGGPPTGSRTFQATKVKVITHNDDFFGGDADEPTVLNIGFRVRLGGGNTNNAAAQVVSGTNPWSCLLCQGPTDGQSHTYVGSEKGSVLFNNVPLPDLGDLLQGAPIEIVGVWAWKVEDDGATGLADVAQASAAAIVAALNQTVGIAAVPNDANQIVNAILAAIGNLGFFQLFATAFNAAINNLNIFSDDAMGSAMYIGVGSSGALGSIIDGVGGFVDFPAVAIPSPIIVPPDIGGGAIFSLGTGTKQFTNNFTNPGVDGQHETTYTFG